MRLFRLDRVLEAALLEETFARPADLDSSVALLSAVANTPGDEWSVEVLLETGVESARWQLPPVGLALEPGLGGARAGRTRVLLRRASSGRPPGGARAACRKDLHLREAHRDGGIVVEKAKLRGRN
jgi:hypothetical protein